MDRVDGGNEDAQVATGRVGREHSRRRVLQLGAAAVGAVAVGGLAGAGRASATTAPASSARRAWGRTEISFDEGWKFVRGNPAGAQAPGFNDTSWRLLDLPHDWSIEDLPYATSDDGAATDDPSTMAFQTTPPPAGTPTVIGPFDEQNSAGGAATGYTVGGLGWYRKEFTLPGGSLASGIRAELRFDGVFHNAAVWLNGTQLGSHVYGYTPFSFDLTPHLVKGTNVVAVSVDNTLPASRWYPGAGIYRHTWLEISGAVRVPDYGVFITTPVAAQGQSTVHIAAEAANLGASVQSAQARVTILSPEGRRVSSTMAAPQDLAAGATNTFDLDITVSGAELWSPSSPRLYTAQTDILVDGSVVDTVLTSFGIRSLVWDATNGLLINGQQTKIRGACLHCNYGPLGSKVLGRSVERQVETLQAAGFNAIRTAHNPPSPYLPDVCDRLGMLIWDEAFDSWSGSEWTPDYVADLTTFIRRDRNHPSVIIWSTGNEVSDPVLGQQLHDIVHALDPTRPATQGATPFDTPADPQYKYTDVSDVHYDFTDKLALRAMYPDKPMTQSESWPATIYDDWQFALDNSWFVGSWVWVGWDYMGESGAGATITATSPNNLPVFGTGPFPWFQDYQGDIDFIGQRKPQNYWRAVVYGLSPIELFVERPAPAGTQQYANNWSYYDELQSWTWDVTAGQVMTVHVYTSGDSVTLRLNGHDIQTQAVAATDRRVATFMVPYTAGELTAIASLGGKTIGVKTLKTTGSPAALKLTPDVPLLTTSRDDLAHVLVEVLDQHGSVVPDAVTQVSFNIRGAGQLLGVGNGNPHNIDSFQRPRRYTWHGQALAILRPAERPGILRLTASAPGLRPDSINLSVRPGRS
jgi:beta-galactosidase